MLFQNMREVLTQIVGVGVVAGIMYLWAYWSTFGIIIFEYANFKDIITATIILLGSALAFVFLGFVSGALLPPQLEPGGGAQTRIGQFFLRRKSVIKQVIATFYWLGLIVLWFVSFPYKTLIFSSLFSLGFSILIQDSEFLSEIKHTRIRSVLISILLFAISFSYLFGKDRAEAILNGGPGILYEVGSGRKYLGHTSGYFFLLAPDNSKVIISRAKSRDELVLTTNANNKPSAKEDD